jgi:hypothetical protein
VAVSKYRVPQNRKIVDDKGHITEEWHNFFSAIGFNQGDAIPQVSNEASNAELAAALNAVVTLLQGQKRIKTG